MYLTITADDPNMIVRGKRSPALSAFGQVVRPALTLPMGTIEEEGKEKTGVKRKALTANTIAVPAETSKEEKLTNSAPDQENPRNETQTKTDGDDEQKPVEVPFMLGIPMSRNTKKGAEFGFEIPKSNEPEIIVQPASKKQALSVLSEKEESIVSESDLKVGAKPISGDQITVPIEKSPQESTSKQEPVKEEPSKGEAAKVEAPKEEPPKGDPPKKEPMKQEPVKEEPSKGDAAKVEAPKEEPPKGDPPKKEPMKQEPVKEEPSKGEAAKVEAPKEEPPKGEPPKQEQVKSDPIKEAVPEDHDKNGKQSELGRKNPISDYELVLQLNSEASSTKPDINVAEVKKIDPPKPNTKGPFGSSPFSKGKPEEDLKKKGEEEATKKLELKKIEENKKKLSDQKALLEVQNKGGDEKPNPFKQNPFGKPKETAPIDSKKSPVVEVKAEETNLAKEGGEEKKPEDGEKSESSKR
jgi:hypothetical protein